MSTLERLMTRHNELNTKYINMIHKSGFKNYDEAHIYVKTKEPELITELIFIRPRIIEEENIKNAWEHLDKFNIIDRIDAQLFKKLAECKCCNKHQLNRPTTYDTLCYSDIINECKQCDDDIICNCKCRHIMRVLVTLK
jgi:hypothetical protein